MADTPLLDIRGLETAIGSRAGVVRAVRGVSLRVDRGETVGLVGESGSGKSITALSIARLLPPAGRITAGEVLLDGQDVLRLSQRALRAVRGRRIGMVFQDSMTALNPLLPVGRQLTEHVRAHLGLGPREATRRALRLLDEVGVTDGERRLRQYPHQLSGGLRQRVAVAIALAADPDLLIADEPTTALDVTIQAQILDLLRREQRDRGMGLLVITHDLGVVAGIADRVAVMYAGRIIEEGATDAVFAEPAHPYTLGLLTSVPRLDTSLDARLPSIPGAPPPLWALDAGCAFRPRCPVAIDRCAADPPLSGERRRVACHVDIRATVP